MKTWLSPARTAGILYLQFTVFSIAVLWLWLGESSWRGLWDELSKIPGAVELFTVIAGLTAASAVLGTWLTLRAKVNLVVLICGGITTIVAFWWNVLAVLFWIAPVAFMLFAYKRANDG